MPPTRAIKHPPLTSTPQPVRLRQAAGLVRQADRVSLASLTGCGATVGGSVALVAVPRAVARRMLHALRARGCRTVLVSRLAGDLVLGACSAIDLPLSL